MKKIKTNNIQVIAEVGVNHNGNLQIAKKLIDGAKECGANYVKFQIFNPEEITTPSARKANYQQKNSSTIKLTVRLSNVSWSPCIGIDLNGVGITTSESAIAGTCAEVVKNSTFGNWCIPNLN